MARKDYPSGMRKLFDAIMNAGQDRVCVNCGTIAERWQKFCVTCGRPNQNFDIKVLQEEFGYAAIEDAIANECPVWHDPADPMIADSKFCPFCGTDIFGTIIGSLE